MPSEGSHWTLRLSKLFGYGVLITAVLVVTLLTILRVPLSAVSRMVAVYFVYTLIISALAWAVMPALGEWTEHKPLLLRWTILVAVLLGAGTLGSAIASPIAYYGLHLAYGAGVRIVFANSLPTALPVTLIAGVITTIIAASRDRLRDSQLALQTQRLERERAEKLAAEAQLASLASRVHPHFLFNTLNSISELIREDPKQAEKTVEGLASLLRSSLNESQTVPVEQEMNLVRDYLEIQKTRLGSRLSFDIRIDPGLQADVLPFSLQTLVENSIKHAGAQRPEGIEVQIRATRLDNDVALSVTDNGPGYDPTAMKSGRGLDNLQSRLRAIYGDRSALEFWRDHDHMTARIRIPAGRRS